MQSEAAECGLTCLAMIMNYHGIPTTLFDLRALHPISLKGLSLHDLIKIAGSYNFNTRALRIETNQIQLLKTPAILHWNLNHFVVLVKATPKKITLHDPAKGLQELSMKDFSKSFTGIALELETDHIKQKIFKKTNSEKLGLYALLKSSQSIKKPLLSIFMLALLLQVLVLAGPQYIQHMVDVLLAKNSLSSALVQTKTLWDLAILFAGLKFIEVAMGLLRSIGIARIGIKFNLEIGEWLFKKLLSLPMGFFEKRHIGDIVSRFAATDKIRQSITQGLIEGLIDGLMSISTLTFMFFYSVSLGSLVITASGLYILVRWKTFYQFKISNEQMIQASALQNTYFMESIRGIQPIKIFAHEDQRAQTWKNYFIDYLNALYETALQKSKFNASKTLIFGLQLITVILLGCLLINQHKFSLGMLYAFLFYQTLFTQSVSNFIDNLLDFKMLSLYIERLSDIALSPPEIAPEKKSLILLPSSTEIIKIQAKEIGFQYAPQDPMIFSHLSACFNHDEITGISAPSGFGKTTFLKLLMGLLIPTEGVIEINGIDLKTIHPKTYRALYASVMQEDCLFSGSLLNNITFFSPQIDFEKAVYCAKKAAIHEEIMAFPMAYQTLVGEMGTVLSGGQKQRLLLARALYADPKILFLDEATSHLDAQNESLVNQSLRELKITCIVIAHRQETLANCDRVIYLDPSSINQPN